jgi:hypothetical protein
MHSVFHLNLRYNIWNPKSSLFEVNLTNYKSGAANHYGAYHKNAFLKEEKFTSKSLSIFVQFERQKICTFGDAE